MTSRDGLLAAIGAQRRFLYLLVTLLTVGGIWAALTLPSAIYPELTFNRITVVTQGSALSAEQTLFAITRPIEEAVSVVPSVTRVQSRSIRGGSEVNITFASGTDMILALQQVQARIDQIEGDLPGGVHVEVARLTPSLFPILSYNLEGGDPATLYDIARYQIKPLISRIPDVARVDVLGSDVREIEIIADPGRLAAHGLGYDSLASIVRAAMTPRAVGRLPLDYRQYLIVSPPAAMSAADLGAITIAPGVRVSDVATIVPSTADRVTVIAGDGRPAAQINVSRQLGGNTLAIADSIAALSPTLQLPPGVRIKPVYDQAELVREAVDSVRDAMIVGAVLAVLVLLAFLRHARVTAISAASIPLTLAITVLVMAALHQTFNLMTLGAMAIAIGLVIDDAVVVTENVVRHLHLGGDRVTAVRAAVRELVWPVTTSTLTTVVVFLPLGLLTGVEGQFFHALSITLTIAVLVSLLLALTIVPLLSERYLAVAAGDAEAQGTMIGLTRWYQGALRRALTRPAWAIGAIVLLAGTAVAGLLAVGSGFLPEIDEGAFVMDYFTPGGTSLDETDRQVHVAEKILLSTPEVEATSRRTGAELGLFATEQNSGDVVVRLKPERDRRRSADQVIDDVRGRISAAVPRLHIEFVQILSDVINDLAGAASPVEIKVFGPDLAALEQYGRMLGAKLAKIDGIEDVYDGVSEPSAEMTMTIDAAAAARAGLTPAAINDQVSAALLGADAGPINQNERSVGIRVRAPDAVRFSPAAIGSIPVTGDHGAVPLNALATFTPAETRAELLRENQQQMIDVTSDLGERSLGDVMHDVRRLVDANPPPAGARVEFAGQYAGQQRAFHALLAVLALAAIAVAGVMVLQFRSFLEPAVVLVGAPLAFAGAFGALAITGTPLNVSSFMGLILLVGLIVKNGIILLDFAHRRARDGMPFDAALVEAGGIRLRPILMTTLCTLCGLLPLALGIGAGSALQRPLAIAVIGGLTLSTPITLFIVPTLLLALRRRRAPVPAR